MIIGLPQDTETNPDHYEILRDLRQHFLIISKDFAIVYYVTITLYNSKSSSTYYVCLGALVLAYFQRARTIIKFPVALLLVVLPGSPQIKRNLTV